MIAKQEQGKGLGLAMLNGLNEIAETVGCYKVGTDSHGSLGFTN